MFASGDFLNEFEALSKLFATCDKRQDDAMFHDTSCVSRTGPSPASVGPKELLDVTVAAPRPMRSKDTHHEPPGAPLSEQGVCVEDDGRQAPSYEFKYKQAVATTDAFLGMSGKDASSACCEDLVMCVLLPEVSGAAELDLDVRDTSVELSCAKYKLKVHLPHKVDSERGRARWHAGNKQLAITMPIVRDDPF